MKQSKDQSVQIDSHRVAYDEQGEGSPFDAWHWLIEEKPEEISGHLIAFLESK